MNRRKFLEFLGKATVASGVVAVSGLPELMGDPNVPVETEDIEPYVRGCNSGSMHSGLTPKTIVRWDGDAWADLGPADLRFRPLYFGSDGVVYVSDEVVEV